MHRLVALTAAVLLLLTGCGDDDGDTTSATTATTATIRATTSTTERPGGIDPMEDASTTPVSVPRPSIPTALLSDVRAARHEGFDRVVFTFRGDEVPGYAVEYASGPVTQDGSGDEVAVAGAHAILVRFDPASGVDLSGPEPEPVYTGPKRFTPDTPEVREVVATGDFEAVLSWAIGVADRVDFRVSTLQDPVRVVIDVQNH